MVVYCTTHTGELHQGTRPLSDHAAIQGCDSGLRMTDQAAIELDVVPFDSFRAMFLELRLEPL